MRLGIDYAWHGKLNPEVWKAKGVTFVCRYFSHNPSKDISKEEAQLLRDHGLDIVIVWETTASRAGDGFDAGAKDAREARDRLRTIGAPADMPLYFAVDFDCIADRVYPYFKGVLSVLPLEQVGAYGGILVIRGLFNAGLITYGWQTSAWSGGKWEPRAHLQQYKYDFSGGGLKQADLNRAMFDDFGQWGGQNKEDEMAIDIVHDSKDVEAARERLAARGIIDKDPKRHPSDYATSNGMLFIIADRIFSLIPEGINLDEYELQLVKKQ